MTCACSLSPISSQSLWPSQPVKRHGGEDWAKEVLALWWSRDWGLPTVIISDRGPKFVQGLWKRIFELVDTKLLYSTAYHPQTDGQLERTNQTAEIALRHAVFMNPDVDWTSLLPAVQMALNSSVKDATFPCVCHSGPFDGVEPPEDLGQATLLARFGDGQCQQLCVGALPGPRHSIGDFRVLAEFSTDSSEVVGSLCQFSAHAFPYGLFGEAYGVCVNVGLDFCLNAQSRLPQAYSKAYSKKPQHCTRLPRSCLSMCVTRSDKPGRRVAARGSFSFASFQPHRRRGF